MNDYPHTEDSALPISMRKRQGASTLTQQLARNLYLHRRRTLKRKIREAITAVKIERTYAKDEVMEMYLTQMYFGHGAYGVQAAAKRYFGVGASGSGERLRLHFVCPSPYSMAK